MQESKKTFAIAFVVLMALACHTPQVEAGFDSALVTALVQRIMRLEFIKLNFLIHIDTNNYGLKVPGPY